LASWTSSGIGIPIRGVGGLEENKAYFWEVTLIIFKDLYIAY